MAEDETKKAKEQTNSKEEQIGFHKGALSTLAKERQELSRILQIVEQLMQMHVGELKEHGIDLQAQAEEAGKEDKKGEGEQKKEKKPIEDIL